MKKTLLILALMGGIGFLLATVSASWKFSLHLPEERFTVNPGTELDGWTISSPVESASCYSEWSVVSGNGRDISRQTIGMWLNLSLLTAPVTICTFGEKELLCGLQLAYKGNGTFTVRRTGMPGQAFSVDRKIVAGGWFNLAVGLDTDMDARTTDFRIYLNGEKIMDKPRISSCLNGSRNGNVYVGEGASPQNSFKIADFKAYDAVLHEDEVREAWQVAEE